jgi:NADPH:quinone reductase-like Zn-dependent oxidoreductase
VRAAILHAYGEPPEPGEFGEPEPQAGQVVVDVKAAAIHHLDLLKATGTFYLGPPPLPSVPGTDGVGTTPDGRRVYFDPTIAPYGSFAQRALASEDTLIEVPEEIDDVTAAALGNTGLGAWLALTWRANLQPGETVLILGANGAFGSVATQAARLLGAGKVIAAARDTSRVRGADEVVELTGAPEFTGPIDVTIDTLWGKPAEAAMKQASRHARHVQVGQLAGTEITLSAPAIRSVSLSVCGFSVAHPPPDVKRDAYAQLARHVANGEIVIDKEVVQLDDIAGAWERQRTAKHRAKLVVVPDQRGGQ